MQMYMRKIVFFRTYAGSTFSRVKQRNVDENVSREMKKREEKNIHLCKMGREKEEFLYLFIDV